MVQGDCNDFVLQLTGTVYGARGIVTNLYGSLQGQSLWCRGNYNKSVWHLTEIQFLVQGEL